MISVGISQKELGESDAEMFKILPRDWNLKPILSIFTQKWASVDVCRTGGIEPPNLPDL